MEMSRELRLLVSVCPSLVDLALHYTLPSTSADRARDAIREQSDGRESFHAQLHEGLLTLNHVLSSPIRISWEPNENSGEEQEALESLLKTLDDLIDIPDDCSSSSDSFEVRLRRETMIFDSVMAGH